MEDIKRDSDELLNNLATLTLDDIKLKKSILEVIQEDPDYDSAVREIKSILIQNKLDDIEAALSMGKEEFIRLCSKTYGLDNLFKLSMNDADKLDSVTNFQLTRNKILNDHKAKLDSMRKAITDIIFGETDSFKKINTILKILLL